MSFIKFCERSAVKICSTKIFRVLKYVVDLYVDIMCRLMFLCIFIIYDCYLKSRVFLDNAFWSLKDFHISFFNVYPNIRFYLEERKRTFRKIPDHVVLILGPEKASHNDLAKLISWCEPLGIRYVSFYDHKKGIDPLLIFEAVKKCHKHIIHKIKWGKTFSEEIKKASIQEINGYRWEGLIRVNILNLNDGNLELVEISKQLHSSGLKSGVDQSWLCNTLERRLGSPPPDLAVVCGPALSYFACLPWHLRLTQFVHIQSHHNIGVSKFLNCLHQYSQCEQRYGK